MDKGPLEELEEAVRKCEIPIAVAQTAGGTALGILYYEMIKVPYLEAKISSASHFQPEFLMGTLIIPTLIAADGIAKTIGLYFNKPRLENGIIEPAINKIHKEIHKGYDFLKEMISSKNIDYNTTK